MKLYGWTVGFSVSAHISNSMLKKLVWKINEKKDHYWPYFVFKIFIWDLGKFQHLLLDTPSLKPCKNYLKTTLKKGKNRHDLYIINLWNSIIQETTWHSQKFLKINVYLTEWSSFTENCLKWVFLTGYRWWLMASPVVFAISKRLTTKHMNSFSLTLNAVQEESFE